MQATWRKTFELLRRHPTLWWPVLLANLCAFGLQSLRTEVHFQIVRWAMTGEHSVPGGPSYGKVVVLGGSVNVLVHYLCIVMFCIALALVARKVDVLLAEATAADEMAIPAQNLQGVVRFSLIVTALMLCTYVLGILLPTLLLNHLDRLELMRRQWFTSLTLVPVYLLQAYVLSPFALAFLNQRRLVEVKPPQRRKGRLASLVAALAFIALFFVLSEVRIPSPPTYAMSLMRDAIISLLTTLPYVALFVGLAVIAFEKDEAEQPLPAGEPVTAE